MNIWNPELLLNAWLPILCFYFVLCWGLPMLGMLSNRWTNEVTGVEHSQRYWYGVRFFSFSTHLALVLTGLIIWALESYIFV